MKRILLVAMVLAAMVLSAAAQDEPTVFRTDTTLIEFTLIAIDKDGNPVTDLKEEEIVVRDKGQPRDLAVFRYEGGEQTRIAPPQLPVGIFTNSPELTPGAPRNVTAIVLDLLNTQPRDQRWVKSRIVRYLDTLLTEPNTRLAVYLLGADLTVLHDFTDDAGSLQASIEQVQVKLAATTLGLVRDLGRDLPGMVQSMERIGIPQDVINRFVQNERLAHASADEQRAQITPYLLEALGDHLAGIPGRKSIVWIGGGFPIMSISGSLQKGTVGWLNSYTDLVQNAARRLAQQGVTMYMFDARGLQTDSSFEADKIEDKPERPKDEHRGNWSAMTSDPVATMYEFAHTTGGRYYWNTNDLGHALREIAADSHGAYSLGFYADGEPDEKWHNLDVSVTRKGVKLKYRDGYTSTPPPQAQLDWTAEQWTGAVFNAVGSTAVQLEARLQFDGGDNAQTVSLVLQISTDDLHFRQVDGQSSASVDLAIVDKLPMSQFQIRDAQREIPYPQGEAREVGVATLSHTWELTPGASVVRLIVRDRLTNRYGSLDVPVKDIPHAPATENAR